RGQMQKLPAVGKLQNRHGPSPWARAGAGAADSVATKCTEIEIFGSLGPDAQRSDQLAPFLGFFGDELAKVGGRACKYRGSQIGKSRFQLGIDEPQVDFGVELVDDLNGNVFRRTYSLPAAYLVAGNKVTDGRDIWQYRGAHRSRHG